MISAGLRRRLHILPPTHVGGYQGPIVAAAVRRRTRWIGRSNPPAHAGGYAFFRRLTPAATKGRAIVAAAVRRRSWGMISAGLRRRLRVAVGRPAEAGCGWVGANGVAPAWERA